VTPMADRNARSEPRRDPSDGAFLRRVLLAVLVGAALVAAWRLSDMLLAAFGAVLVALLLRGLAQALSRTTHIPESWAVAPVVLALLAAVLAAFWLFGSQIATQFDLLAQDLPERISALQRELALTAWGGWFIDRAHEMNLTSATSQIAGYVAALFGSVFRSIAYVAVALFAGVYLSAQPDRYRGAMLRLVPSARRERYAEVLDLIGITLRRWIIGQAVTMAVVGTLTAVGLWSLGVGAPLALGLIAGMLAFIPYVGPILASMPGILMAVAEGPMLAVYTTALYGAVHFVEGNLVTPLVQAEAIKLPPLLILFAALGFGVLLGPVGVLLAAPLTVVLLMAVNTLYLEDVLGERRAWPPQRHDER
jgi:predicted PurR-regulated permease PerM